MGGRKTLNQIPGNLFLCYLELYSTLYGPLIGGLQKLAITLHPSLYPHHLQDCGAAPTRNGVHFPHPLSLGWPCNLPKPIEFRGCDPVSSELNCDPV